MSQKFSPNPRIKKLPSDQIQCQKRSTMSDRWPTQIQFDKKYSVDVSHLFSSENVMLQYKFKPKTIDPAANGVLSVGNIPEVNITLPRIESESQEHFKGNLSMKESNEFILTFCPSTSVSENKTDCFQLRRLSNVVSNIRHIRDEEAFNEKTTTAAATRALSKSVSLETRLKRTGALRIAEHSKSRAKFVDEPKAKKNRSIAAVRVLIESGILLQPRKKRSKPTSIAHLGAGGGNGIFSEMEGSLEAPVTDDTEMSQSVADDVNETDPMES